LGRRSRLAGPPVFIIGCGRSGTSILGTTLSKHSSVTYLNERRDLWSRAYPVTDIWSDVANERGGKMVLTAADETASRSRRLRESFVRETLKSHRPVLVEKLPINNFRLRFIQAIFPDVKFIHIYRNGLEVARSIELRCQAGGWYGPDGYKWKQLVDFAMSKQDSAGLPATCAGYYEKGLLEWRLSTGEAVAFLSEFAAERFIEFSYADLVSSPLATVSSALTFMGLPMEPDLAAFVDREIQRRTKPREDSSLSAVERAIGGSLLELSRGDSSGGGITKRWKSLA